MFFWDKAGEFQVLGFKSAKAHVKIHVMKRHCLPEPHAHNPLFFEHEMKGSGSLAAAKRHLQLTAEEIPTLEGFSCISCVRAKW